MGADSRSNAAGSDAKLTTNRENQITNLISCWAAAAATSVRRKPSVSCAKFTSEHTPDSHLFYTHRTGLI
jgi:hypothetical protein